MVWITAEDVAVIHSLVVEKSGGMDGIRDKDALEAALSAPLQTFGGAELFPADLERIARLGFGLAANYAFLDGNKRIDAMMVQLFLQWNGYTLQLQQGELADMFLVLAAGSATEQDLLCWIQQHLRGIGFPKPRPCFRHGPTLAP